MRRAEVAHPEVLSSSIAVGRILREFERALSGIIGDFQKRRFPVICESPEAM